MPKYVFLFLLFVRTGIASAEDEPWLRALQLRCGIAAKQLHFFSRMSLRRFCDDAFGSLLCV